jgi:hypothetical protein
MTFSILILIFLGAVAFFHYIQGFFSATLSAILTVFAAVIAFSYHESLAPYLVGKMPDYAAPICLLALFGISYLIMRIPFDKAIPGTLRLPLMVDKVGAVVMGLIAGVFATGIMAIAAAEMPFGADIAGFTRFDTEATRDVKVETKGKSFYSKTYSELMTDKAGEFGADSHGVSIAPVDNAVVSFILKLSSETGSLQNGKPLESVHPDFLTETFGQRLGIEPTASRVAINLGAIQMVKVLGLYDIDSTIPKTDDDNVHKAPITLAPPLPGTKLVAVRVMFSQQASDSDTNVRFSTGSVRLMLHDPSSSAEEPYRNYFPVGTMEGTGRLMLAKLDDYLFCKQGNGADFVFSLPKALIDKGIPDGSFLEVKRNARVDVGGKKVEPSLTPNADVAVIRKELVMHPEQNGGAPLGNTPAPTAAQANGTAKPTTPAASTGAKPAATALTVDTIAASNAVPVNISLPPGADNNALLSAPGGGTAKLERGKLKNINMDASTLELKTGDKMTEFAVPAGQVMIQVKVVPVGSPGDAWAFATDPEQYEIVDSTAKHYPPNGIVAVYRGLTGERVKMGYIDTKSIGGAAAPAGAEAPSQVFILYNVPTNTTITDFDDHGQKVKTTNVVAK